MILVMYFVFNVMKNLDFILLKTVLIKAVNACGMNVIGTGLKNNVMMKIIIFMLGNSMSVMMRENVQIMKILLVLKNGVII